MGVWKPQKLWNPTKTGETEVVPGFGLRFMYLIYVSNVIVNILIYLNSIGREQ